MTSAELKAAIRAFIYDKDAYTSNGAANVVHAMDLLIDELEGAGGSGGGGGSQGIDEVLTVENDAGGQIIKNIGTPVDGQDAATKAFVLGSLGELAGGYLKYVAIMYLNTTPQNDGVLIIGNTYKIQTYNVGDDFINVGAVSNAQDEIFTAIGTTPTVYSNGSGLIDLTPKTDILENTIGEIVWSRLSIGTYLGSLVGAFPAEKTWSMVSQTYAAINYILQVDGEDAMTLSTVQENSGVMEPHDALHEVPIEIRVYP